MLTHAVGAHMEVREQLAGVGSLYCVCFKGQTQVVSLGSEQPYHLNHSPALVFLYHSFRYRVRCVLSFTLWNWKEGFTQPQRMVQHGWITRYGNIWHTPESNCERLTGMVGPGRNWPVKKMTLISEQGAGGRSRPWAKQRVHPSLRE